MYYFYLCVLSYVSMSLEVKELPFWNQWIVLVSFRSHVQILDGEGFQTMFYCFCCSLSHMLCMVMNGDVSDMQVCWKMINEWWECSFQLLFINPCGHSLFVISITILYNEQIFHPGDTAIRSDLIKGLFSDCIRNLYWEGKPLAKTYLIVEYGNSLRGAHTQATQ